MIYAFPSPRVGALPEMADALPPAPWPSWWLAASLCTDDRSRVLASGPATAAAAISPRPADLSLNFAGLLP